MTSENKVEAVLFAAGKEVGIEEISRITGLSEKDVERAIESLARRYDDTGSSLMISTKKDSASLGVREKYIPYVQGLAAEVEMDKAIMETLATIAWKYPLSQAELIKIRHNKAYEHVKILQEEGYIVKEKHGRTYKLKLTQKFFNYFDLPAEKGKEAIKEAMPDEIKKVMEKEG